MAGEAPGAAYGWRGIDPLTARRKFEARRRARRMRRRFMLCVFLAGIIAAGAWFALVWMPDYRAQIAERLRQAQWALEEAQHPFAYRSLVEGYAETHELDPALVAAVILNESSYNPRAESYLGARGLMQLMPETAEWVAHKLRESYDAETLFDPETNIRFGCWFLGYLSDRFDGDPVKMAAGYHAGAGQVDTWLSNPEYSADGALNVIPFKDTNRYVNKVMSAYEVYQRHYYTNENESAGAGA
jgi:soluble lytic murein transglycosylase